MSYSERVKEIGMLTSIGMTKKQIKNMLFKEASILAVIGIVVGLIIGSGLSFFWVKILDILSRNVGVHEWQILMNADVRFYMVLPTMCILITFIIVYIITIISAMLPVRKLIKISPIDAIRNTEPSKVTQKSVKTPKIINKIFKQEGVLAYKNIRKEKTRYKSIVLSVVISIVLFITVNEILTDYLITFSQSYDKSFNYKELYLTYMGSGENKKEYIKTSMEYLQKKGLIESYLATSGRTDLKLEVPIEKCTELGKVYNPTHYAYNELTDKNVNMLCTVETAIGPEYDELLKKYGIKELKNGECILADFQNGTKYGDNARLTNYEVRRYFKISK